ncbi:hypothetical protein DSN44_13615, partial [Enterococcus faecalis]|nr:hypothetical protein [Enterococcus faecalis]
FKIFFMNFFILKKFHKKRRQPFLNECRLLDKQKPDSKRIRFRKSKSRFASTVYHRICIL